GSRPSAHPPDTPLAADELDHLEERRADAATRHGDPQRLERRARRQPELGDQLPDRRLDRGWLPDDGPERLRDAVEERVDRRRQESLDVRVVVADRLDEERLGVLGDLAEE